MKKIISVCLILTLAFALSACGSKKEDSSDSIAEPAEAVGTEAAASEIIFKASSDTFKFDKEEYTVKKGEPVKLTLENVKGTHALRIDALDVNLKGSKLSQTITPDKAGTYVINCSFPCGNGHMSMKAKLIVT